MNTNQQNIDFEALVAMYLSGNASQGDLELLESIVRTDPEKKKLFIEIRKNWRIAGTADISFNQQEAWEKIKNKLIENTSERNIKPLYTHRGKSSKKPFLLKIAAALILLIMGTYSAYYYTTLHKKTFVAQTTPSELMLRDGSRVVVNAGSTLEYPASFRSNERKVKLQGEAWFEVKPDPKSQFVVQAENLEIRVLGTSFHVRTIKRDDITEVIVTTGSVALSAHDQPILTLQAGEKGIYYQRTGELSGTLNTNPNHLSWQTKKMVFEDTSLKDVFETIGHTFRITFELQDELLSNCRLTATFDNQSLQDVLTIVAETFNLRYTRSDNIVKVSGEGCIENTITK